MNQTLWIFLTYDSERHYLLLKTDIEADSIIFNLFNPIFHTTVLTKTLIAEITYVAIEGKYPGPGLIKSVYHQCMRKKMLLQRNKYISELPVPVEYEGMNPGIPLYWDFFEDCIDTERKVVRRIATVFQTQLLPGMKLLKVPKKILINLNTKNIINEGRQTVVNALFRKLPELSSTPDYPERR